MSNNMSAVPASASQKLGRGPVDYCNIISLINEEMAKTPRTKDVTFTSLKHFISEDGEEIWGFTKNIDSNRREKLVNQFRMIVNGNNNPRGHDMQRRSQVRRNSEDQEREEKLPPNDDYDFLTRPELDPVLNGLYNRISHRVRDLPLWNRQSGEDWIHDVVTRINSTTSAGALMMHYDKYSPSNMRKLKPQWDANERSFAADACDALYAMFPDKAEEAIRRMVNSEKKASDAFEDVIKDMALTGIDVDTPLSRRTSRANPHSKPFQSSRFDIGRKRLHRDATSGKPETNPKDTNQVRSRNNNMNSSSPTETVKILSCLLANNNDKSSSTSSTLNHKSLNRLKLPERLKSSVRVVLDSGAKVAIVNDVKSIANNKPWNKFLVTIDGSVVDKPTVSGVLSLCNGAGDKVVNMQAVHVKNAPVNVIPLNHFAEMGWTYSGQGKNLKITSPNNKHEIAFTLDNGLFYINNKATQTNCEKSNTSEMQKSKHKEQTKQTKVTQEQMKTDKETRIDESKEQATPSSSSKQTAKPHTKRAADKKLAKDVKIKRAKAKAQPSKKQSKENIAQKENKIKTTVVSNPNNTGDGFIFYVDEQSSDTIQVSPTPDAQNQDAADNIASELHKRFHVSPTYLINAIQNNRIEVPADKKKAVTEAIKRLPMCESCQLANPRQLPHLESKNPPSYFLHKVHADLIGPITHPGVGNIRYILTVVDGYSNYIDAKCLANKSEATDAMKAILKLWLEQHPSSRRDGVCTLQVDGGLEFSPLRKFCSDNGIEHRINAPYQSQTNGRAEVTNRILAELARSLIIDSNLPNRFWPFAVVHACNILNLSRSSKVKDDKGKFLSPYKAFWNRIPCHNAIKRLGSRAYARLNPTQTEGKMKARAKLVIYLGSPNGYDFFCWDPFRTDVDSVVRIRDVVVDEQQVGLSTTKAYRPELYIDETIDLIDEKIRENLRGLKVPKIKGTPHSTVRAVMQEFINMDPTRSNADIYNYTHKYFSSDSLDEKELEQKENNDPINKLQQAEKEDSSLSNDAVIQDLEANVSSVDEAKDRGVETEETTPDEDKQDFTKRWNAMCQRVMTSNRKEKKLKKVNLLWVGAALIRDSSTLFNEDKTVNCCDRFKKLFKSGEKTTETQRVTRRVPLSFSQITASDKDRWLKACDTEMKAFEDNDVPEEIDIDSVPKGKRILPGMWVFTEKAPTIGELLAKARYVVLGNFEVILSGSNSSPVSKRATIFILMSIGASLDLEIEQMDVSTAFLNAKLSTDTYMRMPQGYEKPGKVWKLKKALYGLRSAPIEWYKTLRTFLTEEVGLTAHIRDPCCFYNIVSSPLFVSVHVDDLLIIGIPEGVNMVKEKLNAKYKMKDQGPVAYFLGVDVERDREKRTITLKQERYVEAMLQDFKINNQTHFKTPIATKTDSIEAVTLEKGEMKASEKDVNAYRHWIGRIGYLAQWTRPDIAFAMSILARGGEYLTPEHVTALVRIMGYLNRTRNWGVSLGGKRLEKQLKETINEGKPLMIESYTDASYLKGDKSQSGGVIGLGGKMINWFSKRQTTCAGSTMDAEYASAHLGFVDATEYSHFFKEFGWDTKVHLVVDNAAALYSMHKLGTSAREGTVSNHQLRLKEAIVGTQFNWESDAWGKTYGRYIETTKMPADILTKGMGPTAFDRSIKVLRSMGLSTDVSVSEAGSEDGTSDWYPGDSVMDVLQYKRSHMQNLNDRL